MTKKTAIVTGITGQDGSYLSELLLQSNYTVIACRRRSSTNNLERVAHLLDNPNYEENTKDLANATEHIIPGGNHAYFGFYGEQKGDNPALQTNKEIQDYVATYIVTELDTLFN